MKDDRKQNDRSQYTDTGFRDPDGRQGFGDDAGTRVGRPDGAESAHTAPRDAQLGDQVPGQPSTNTDPVSNGIEGSLTGDGSEGPAQSRVRAAAEDVERPDGSSRAGSADSRIDDL
ncbi:hypothetical protein [Roseisolibacter agri]|uniref:Uncharacterized protein n=1 Tax=Roseisolibacter agri TaxID=2014610 RepID=A0AA37PZF3_9BACT|nr:hypothetical protein [Roseisolibacter agri]GLC23599.1 hypothetical protein rosag_01120 [Roseisolibacter agri]